MITCQIASIAYNELLDYMRKQADDTFPDLKDEQRLSQLAEKWYTHAEFCLCRDNDMLVGIIVFYANSQDTNIAYIPHVYVSPEYRRNGLFSQMLKNVKAFVKRKGFGEIRLEVETKNETAQRSYQHNGFRFLTEEIVAAKTRYMSLLLT